MLAVCRSCSRCVRGAEEDSGEVRLHHPLDAAALSVHVRLNQRYFRLDTADFQALIVFE